MTSAYSNSTSSVKIEGDSVRVSTTNNRYHEVDNNQRSHLQTKRAATLDPETNKDRFRIVVLGATRVGKTCLCQQFLQEKFVTDHKETVDELHSVELALGDRQMVLEILDTAGIEEFPVMRRIAITHGNAFLILYAINDAHSFVMAQKLYQLILEIKGDSTTSTLPIIIVANKSDLKIDQCEVNEEHAKSLVQDQWKRPLVETTCQNHESVLNAFGKLFESANINIAYGPDILRRSSDPSLFMSRGQRTTNKRQSCAQQ